MQRVQLRSLLATLLAASCAPVPDEAADATETAAEAYTGRAGDLRPTGLTASCVGGTLTVRGAITHGGALPVGASVAQVRVGLWPVTTTDVAVPALSGGASAPVALTRAGLAAGPYVVTLVADARAQVSEGSEANNSASVSVTCGAATPLPDLRVEDARTFCLNGAGFVAYDLVNRGGGAAGASTTYVRVPVTPMPGYPTPQSEFYVATASIAAGGRLHLTHAYGTHQAGGFAVTADIRGAVGESDETNNGVGVLFTGCP